MKIVNKLFKEVVDYVDKNTSLTIKVRDLAMSSITLVGKTGEFTNLDLSIEFGDNGMYECNGSISYQGYDANPTNIIGIRKSVKTEKEVVELIEKAIATANKLSQTIYQLEKEMGE